ncbi:MAG: hypothetical protein KQI81_15205 [Deltaproteobacteria bacterium]|nr:hypothetical protein [Deltaproteobacteria bacterium]
MKKKNVFRLATALLVIIGLVVVTGVMAAEKATQQTIQGKVEQGNKGTAVIKTDDGQTFKILGQNMATMIGKTVKITGTLSKEGNAARSIIVTHFEEVQD